MSGRINSGRMARMAEAAKDLRNDYPVILRGKIERFLGG
jgi:hypothetical protein